jgi:signal transduction histidine kinase/DNA-binding NarL/FixJ family response regulator
LPFDNRILRMVSPTQRTERWHDADPLNCVVLIVEDSESDRVTYRKCLESSSFLVCDIYECEIGEDALRLCKRYHPDIILLDYLLPDSNGIELLQEFATQLEVMPSVIMLTGEGSEAVAVQAMKLGAKDYFIKGQLTSENLANSVVNILREQKLKSQIRWQYRQRNLVASVASRISQASELSEIIQVAVEGARELIDCDRTLVYRLAPDGSGIIIAEAVLPQWTSVFGCRIEDNCFQGEQSHQLEKYLQGRKMVLADIESANLETCYARMLKDLQVKANLVVPILFRDVSNTNEVSIWGLLIAHHCNKTHEWRADEIDLMDEIAVQMAIAIQQAELVSDLQASLEKQQAAESQLREYTMELEQSNLQLAQSTSLLERRNEELNEFTYIASHDLKAPLRGIANLSQWLVEDLQDRLPAENKQQLDRIQGQVFRMDELIDGLLQYSRVGKENIALKSVNLSQLLQEVIDFLAPNPELQIRLPANLPELDTIEVLLKQVFSNLIGNSIKYHNKIDGKIEILALDRESFFQFAVMDDGPGIEPKHHQKIFSIFQTLAKSNDAKGTGVGLAIVKKIVEGQGGSIWVESQVGEGSTFSFTWPKKHLLSTTELAKVDEQ